MPLRGFELAFPKPSKKVGPKRAYVNAGVAVSTTNGNRFSAMSLRQPIRQAIDAVGYEEPSPIQEALIPLALEGHDCIGQAHTGTGKTAAFVIPILNQVDAKSRKTQALILAPTRELSEQVATESRRLSHFMPCRTLTVVGGRPLRSQMTRLKEGVQVVVGTPGRVLDLLGRGALDPTALRVVVLDEADRMLDIGFRPDIERILRQCPRERQTLLLSATVPPPVERLAKRYMADPQRIDLSQDSVAVDSIKQFYITVDQDRKFPLLTRLLVRERPQQALVFTRTKRGADSLYQRFRRKLPDVATIHGDLPQKTRDSVMRRFRNGETRLLIATDVVGRGIDVSGISHIINYDIPEFDDDYVHRIGRTGRLSSADGGCAFTFVTPAEGNQLTNVEKRINQLLNEYKIDGFEAARPKPPRPRINGSR